MLRIIFATAILLCVTPASARDLGQWGNEDPAIREWYQALMQPDVPTASCKAQASAILQARALGAAGIHTERDISW